MDKIASRESESTKKPPRSKLRIFLTLVCLLVLVLVLLIVESFKGNPISKYRATRAAKAYIEQNYNAQLGHEAGRESYRVEEVYYNFKNGAYTARVRQGDSLDKHFSVDFSRTGKLIYDDYESVVLSGFNTALRLDGQYADLVRPILKSLPADYIQDIAYGSLYVFGKSDLPGDPFDNPHSLAPTDLQIDRDYDILDLARLRGHLVIYLSYGQGSFEEAAEVLSQVKAQFEANGLPFYDIDLSLTAQAPDKDQTESPRVSKFKVEVQAFKAEDIVSDRATLVEKVRQADKERREYYAELDKTYKKWEPDQP